MKIVPLEKRHFSEIDWSQTNRLPIHIIPTGNHRTVWGKTAIHDGKVVGIGLITFYGYTVVASLFITKTVKKHPILFIKSIKSAINEIYKEGCNILAAASGGCEREFLEYLGFQRQAVYVNNGVEIARYQYGSSTSQ